MSLQEQWYDARLDEEGYAPPAFGGRMSTRQTDPSSYQIGPTELRFARWCLVPAARLLLCDGQSVELGSRAFDLLHLLLSQRGVVVEKAAIVSFVWPSTFVEESNLRFQIGALRKTLGADGSLIKTIPGRGYIFAADYQPA